MNITDILTEREVYLPKPGIERGYLTLLDDLPDPRIWKIPWRRNWQPTPGFLPGEFHGQGSLEGWSPRGCKELTMTERLTHGPLRGLLAAGDTTTLMIPDRVCPKFPLAYDSLFHFS